MTEFHPSRFEIPLVLKNLIIINVLFFLAQSTVSKELFNISDWFALHHLQSPLFKPWQLVTYLFLHADLPHLFFNMFGLWMFGARLESIWGPRRFLTFYFLCGIGAGLLQLGSYWYETRDLMSQFAFLKSNLTASNLTSFLHQFGGNPVYLKQTAINTLSQLMNAPTDVVLLQRSFDGIQDGVFNAIRRSSVGASGAVFGVMAAFVYLFPNNMMHLNFFIPMKVKWFGLIYFGIEVYSILQDRPGDNVAHWAHLGGGIVGFLLVLTYNQNRRRFY